MFKFIPVLLILLLLAYTSALEITPTVSVAVAPIARAQKDLGPIICGGVGNIIDARLDGCKDFTDCEFQPGQLYKVEVDFIPAYASESLSLQLQICLESGACTIVMDVVLAGDGNGIHLGQMYTVKFSIVPNDILSGQRVQFRSTFYHTSNPAWKEICIALNTRVA